MLSPLGLRTHGSLRGPLIASLSGVTFAVFLVMGTLICLFTARFEHEMWVGRQNEAASAAAAAVSDWYSGRQRELARIALLDPSLSGIHPDDLSSDLSTGGGWQEIVSFDSAGIPLHFAALGRSAFNTPLPQPPPLWFQNAAGGQPSLTTRLSASSRQPDLILAVPAPGGGVLVGVLDPMAVHRAVDSIHLGQTGAISIIDSTSGILVAQHSPDGVNDRIPTTQRGRVLSQTTSIPGLSWNVVTTLQAYESQLIMRTAVTGFTVGLLALWGLTTLLSARFLRRMVFVPVDHLRRGVETMGQGNLNYRITILNDDEIGAVTGEFNHMAARLAEDEHRLLFARDQVLQANRLRSEILANVSHELRTPLGIILGLAEMLQQGNYGPILPAQSQPLADIIQSSGQLNYIINNLLDQSQLDAHTANLAQAPFSTTGLIDDAAETARYQAGKKGLKFCLAVAKDLPSTLCGDPVRLRQIMLNLLDNAVKFTTAGKIELRVYRPGPDHWAVQVADTGCGIPAEARQLIFEPFRQIDGSATREQNGAGLGLSIVRHLVDLMNGSILLESQVGSGSTFTVLLPIIPLDGKKL